MNLLAQLSPFILNLVERHPDGSESFFDSGAHEVLRVNSNHYRKYKSLPQTCATVVTYLVSSSKESSSLSCSFPSSSSSKGKSFSDSLEAKESKTKKGRSCCRTSITNYYSAYGVEYIPFFFIVVVFIVVVISIFILVIILVIVEIILGRPARNT